MRRRPSVPKASIRREKEEGAPSRAANALPNVVLFAGKADNKGTSSFHPFARGR